MSGPVDVITTWPKRGQAVFAIAFILFTLALIIMLWWQTSWVEGTDFLVQPRFWPAVSIGGMLLFGCLHIWRLPQHRLTRHDYREAVVWASGFEFVAWFIAYVWLVPYIGYLFSTVIFVPLLARRLGYRSFHSILVSVLFGVAVVVVFKSFLGVKIPGGAVYEYFPDTIRNLFIINF